MAILLGGAGNYNDASAYNYANSGVAGYLSQMRGILKQEEKLQALGAQGDGGGCTVSRQMSGLLPEVLGSEGGFEQDLAGSDFGSALREAENLQMTIARIAGEGLTAPAGAAETVTGTEQGISAGVTTTNKQISAENALVDKAYSMASAMAAIPAAYTGENGSYSGSCKPASWPFQPPAPIQDVSE